MSKAISLIVSQGIGTALQRALARARERVIIAAPYVKAVALERLLRSAPASAELTVITRWRADEIAAGVSDLEVWDLVQRRPTSRIILQPLLHAKAYVVDEATAFVGSANVTEAALGFEQQENLELVVQIDPVPVPLLAYLRRLEMTGTLPTEELRRDLEEIVRVLKRAPGTIQPGLPPVPRAPSPRTCSPYSFPSFRAPDRLYQGYVTLESLRTPQERHTLIEDLAVLGLTDGLTEREFRVEVGKRLLGRPAIAAFDEFVVQARRFGELTDWLESRDPMLAADHDQCQRYLQTLIRWLCYFLPERYRLEQPHYAEIFGRVEGWSMRS